MLFHLYVLYVCFVVCRRAPEAAGETMNETTTTWRINEFELKLSDNLWMSCRLWCTWCVRVPPSATHSMDATTNNDRSSATLDMHARRTLKRLPNFGGQWEIHGLEKLTLEFNHVEISDSFDSLTHARRSVARTRRPSRPGQSMAGTFFSAHNFVRIFIFEMVFRWSCGRCLVASTNVRVCTTLLAFGHYTSAGNTCLPYSHPIGVCVCVHFVEVQIMFVSFACDFRFICFGSSLFRLYAVHDRERDDGFFCGRPNTTARVCSLPGISKILRLDAPRAGYPSAVRLRWLAFRR